MTEGEASSTPLATTTEPPGRAERVPASSTWWQHITFERSINTLQALSLVVGIWIALYQTRKVREAIDTSTWSSLAAQLSEVDRQFVDHPELTPYSYGGEKIDQSNPLYLKAYSVGVLVIDSWIVRL